MVAEERLALIGEAELVATADAGWPVSHPLRGVLEVGPRREEEGAFSGAPRPHVLGLGQCLERAPHGIAPPAHHSNGEAHHDARPRRDPHP